MHLLAEDVNAWWQRLHDRVLVTTYGISLTKPELRPWGMRDFTLSDPSGVLQRIAENVPKR